MSRTAAAINSDSDGLITVEIAIPVASETDCKAVLQVSPEPDGNGGTDWRVTYIAPGSGDEAHGDETAWVKGVPIVDGDIHENHRAHPSGRFESDISTRTTVTTTLAGQEEE